MAQCPLYFEHVQPLRSREIGGDGAVRHVVVPCCDHQHSPAPRHIAPKVIGGANLLKCSGDLEKCQVAADVRGDPSIMNGRWS